MIDDVRALVERIDNERASLRDLIAGSTERLEALDNLVAPLRAFIEQPAQGSRRADPVRVGSPAPASRSTAGRPVDSTTGWVACPDCHERVRAQGLGAHRSRSKAHAAAINAKARQVVDLPVATRRAPAAEKNPRSTAPLDLPPRLDQAVGE